MWKELAIILLLCAVVVVLYSAMKPSETCFVGLHKVDAAAGWFPNVLMNCTGGDEMQMNQTNATG